MGFSTSSPLAAVGTLLPGMFFQFLAREWDGNLPICPYIKGLLLGSQKSSLKLLHSSGVLPCSQCSVAACSSCAGYFVLERSHSEEWQWGPSPEILRCPAHQVCCCWLQEKMCLHPSSSVILWAAHGFSPKYRIFSILLSPIPLTCTEPKTNWGMAFGLRAVKPSVLLPLQKTPNDAGRVWMEPQEQSSVCCARSCSAAVAVLCVRVAARVGMCVFVCLRLGA